MDSLKEKISSPYLQKDISDLLPPYPANYYYRKFTKREKIKRLRRSLEAGKLMGPACRDACLHPATLQVWKKKSHNDRLWKFICMVRDRGQETRNEIVMDAQFRRLASGEATSSEYEFYLCNRVPELWKKLKDNTVVVQNTINNEVQSSGAGTFNGEDAELVSTVRAKLFPQIPD